MSGLTGWQSRQENLPLIADARVQLYPRRTPMICCKPFNFSVLTPDLAVAGFGVYIRMLSTLTWALQVNSTSSLPEVSWPLL